MKSLVKRNLRRIAGRIAAQVRKNELFEQPGERVKQEKIKKSPIPAQENVSMGDVDSIQRSIREKQGWSFLLHWASWCDGCMEEIPQVLEISEWLKENEVSIHGVCWELFNGTPPQHAFPVVAHIHSEHAFPFQSTIIQDAPEDFFQELDIQDELIPQIGLYRDGSLVYSHVGLLKQEEITTIKKQIMEKQGV